MTLRPTMVQLPAELISRLDRKAAQERISRSQVIRDAVHAYLDTDTDEAIAAAYEEGYGRTPFGRADDWGDLEAFHDALARDRHRTGNSA